MGWGYLAIIYAICLLACAIGFKKYVYFLSIGYGFAIAAGGLTVLILCAANGWTEGVSGLALLQALIFVAYGARLSGFLLAREAKNAAYRKTLKEATGNDKKMPVFVLVFMWIFVSALYTAQLSPMFFRHYNGAKDVALPLVGIAISICGLVIETFADLQKSAQKKKNPHMVATEGLYKMVRCPNYFGEVTFWTGVFIAGITGFRTAGQWIMAVVALIAIWYIMFDGAKRLEARQNKNYGGKAEYQEYVKKTPIILPLVPIYHLAGKEKASK